jgi:hypothetical protein
LTEPQELNFDGQNHQPWLSGFSLTMKSIDLQSTLIRLTSAATLDSSNPDVWKTKIPEYLVPVVFLQRFRPLRDVHEL